MRIAILGTGSIGRAIAEGLVASRSCEPGELHLTRRHIDQIEDLAQKGFRTTADNPAAVDASDLILVAVEPNHLDEVLIEIAGSLEADRHFLVSVVSGAKIDAIRRLIGPDVPVVRAMPNTAIALRESMTCIASQPEHAAARDATAKLFDAVGTTLIVEEEHMVPATALCACGIAFFLRAVRAACQGAESRSASTRMRPCGWPRRRRWGRRPWCGTTALTPRARSTE